MTHRTDPTIDNSCLNMWTNNQKNNFRPWWRRYIPQAQCKDICAAMIQGPCDMSSATRQDQTEAAFLLVAIFYCESSTTYNLFLPLTQTFKNFQGLILMFPLYFGGIVLTLNGLSSLNTNDGLAFLVCPTSILHCSSFVILLLHLYAVVIWHFLQFQYLEFAFGLTSWEVWKFSCESRLRRTAFTSAEQIQHPSQ